MGFIGIVIVAMIIFISFKQPIEKKVLKQNDDKYSRNWFLNKPVMFFDLEDVTSPIEYLYYPSGLCDQESDYDGCNIHDVSLSNIIVESSDLHNVYIYNGTINTCNIQDATIISSNLWNCWIGENVTFLNCPPGSNPPADKKLAEFICEGNSNIFNSKYNSYQNLLAESNTILSILNNSNPIKNEIFNNSDIMSFIMEKTNNTINTTYSDFNISSASNSYQINVTSGHSVDYFGSMVNGFQSINYNFNMTVYGCNNVMTYSLFLGEIVYNDEWNIFSNNIYDYQYYISIDNIFGFDTEYWKSNILIEGDNSSESDEIYSIIYHSQEDVTITYSFSEKVNSTFSFEASSNGIINHENDNILSKNIFYYNNSIIAFNRIGVNNSMHEATLVSGQDPMHFYLWTIENNDNDTTYMLNTDGIFADPYGECLSKDYKTKFGVKVGVSINFYIKIYKNEVQQISSIINVGGGVATIIASILGIIAAWSKKIVWGILACSLTVVFASYVICWNAFKAIFIDPDDEDNLELKYNYQGFYFIGGTVQAYAYCYDRGETIVPISNPTSIGGSTLALLSKSYSKGEKLW